VELGSAVDGLERLPVDPKLDENDWCIGIWSDVAEPIDVQDLGVLEDRNVVMYTIRSC
jgi:hypothetical protein